MLNFEELIGQRFGRLTVISLHHKEQRYKGNKKDGFIYYFLCQCKCGNIKILRKEYLKKTISCGCFKKDNPPKKTHGLTETKIYECWQNMKRRCFNKRNKRYKNYGGRGITVCEEWRNDFQVFYDWAINNGYDDTLTIDRINVNDNYCPDNCRWISRKEQQNNTTRNHFLTYNGETHTLSEWAEKLGFTYSTINHRVQRKWDINKIMTMPQRNKKEVI